MNVLFVVARAVHFGATMLLFGELVFALFVAASASQENHAGLRRHVRIATAWALVVSVLAGVGWLVIEAANMAGTPIGPGFGKTVAIVLRQTEFGHVVSARVVLIVALAVSLLSVARAKDDGAMRMRSMVALAFATFYLGMLAGEGHAAADTGKVGIVHFGADALHLLAAGGWLGALPPLVYCFGTWRSDGALAQLVRRFSVLGMVCVGTLIASGIINALFLIGSFAALFGTPYGQLLIVKLALFAVMLGIAATNRFRLTPLLADANPAPARTLRRNAVLETIGGIAIVTIVGALGVMVPGAHQSPVWPLPFVIDVSLDEASRPEIIALVVIGVFALASIALIVSGMRRKAVRTWVAGCIALLISAAASMSVLAIPAYPTTYASSPVPYTVDAVARGADWYAHDCASCHGAQARGDGPLAASLAVKPADLAEHALHHPPGNLFWWIAHGIPKTPMPAFSPRLTDRDIWETVQFLVARASAQAAMSRGPHVDHQSMSRAPDFAYEAPGQEQRTLAGQRTPALLVLYATQDSHERLAQLASDHLLARVNLRLIPIAVSDSTNDDTRAIVGSSVAGVYRMFMAPPESTQPTHVELLIDGAGILRARWTGIPSASGDRDAEIAAAVQALPSASNGSMPMHHGHH